MSNKVLVVSSRFPWPTHSGDRKRASDWVTALAQNARVALVAPPGIVPEGMFPFSFFPAAKSRMRLVRGAASIMRRGMPVQSLLTAGFVWDRAIEEARRATGQFDATVVILSRADPWVLPSLNGGVRIIEAVDSLRRNAEERGRAASMPMRQFWRNEERKLARVERRLGRDYDHVVVVSEDEIGEFEGDVVAISNSVRICPLDESSPRGFDFGFWGRLPYFANADAARWLLDEIVPAVRERHPAATFAIAGAEAPRGLRAAAARAGVDLQSPVGDIAAFARGVRVAIAPMRYGSGQSCKLIEAAEAGCAIVTTPHAARGLPEIARHAIVVSDTESIATAAVALLRDDARRAAMGTALRRAVEQHHSHEQAHTAMARLAGAAVNA